MAFFAATAQAGNWRTYRHEWVCAYTSDLTGEDGRDECMSVFAERWAGRVRGEDAEVVPVSRARPEQHPCVIRLRVWNLVAESRGQPADSPGTVTVPASSPEERALLDYGRKKLPQ